MSTAIKFVVKNRVTVPLLKIQPDKPIYVKFTGEIFKAKEVAGSRVTKDAEGQPKKQPPELAHCVNLETGEHVQIIIGTVLGGELKELKDGYVNKSFEIIQHKVQGKAYATYSITEIEVEGEEEPGLAPAKGKKAA